MGKLYNLYNSGVELTVSAQIKVDGKYYQPFDSGYPETEPINLNHNDWENIADTSEKLDGI